ncbi:hypothetical protein F5882DRAFT_386496 [Hyaloscypha sp. PMI_1271]|nr:hypothetical protein F5882DRAFT_386496 [Hyaloscypha sp. PMI_1271]
MGLVPLTLKDIAWPKRRVVSISRQVPRLLEVFVRALGIVPSIDTFSPEKHAICSTTLYGWTLKLTHKRLILVLALSAFSLILSYGILAVTEVYSKRSSLGCPYPIFVLTWNLLAIFPAALETAFRRPARIKPTREVVSQPNGADDIEQNKELPDEATEYPFISTGTSQSAGDIRHRHVAEIKQLDSAPAVQKRLGIPLEDTSPIQGRGKPWLVQLVRAVYYIAGTLVYSSIMAVTVAELTVWVITSITVTAAGKFLAFFLCIAVQREH